MRYGRYNDPPEPIDPVSQVYHLEGSRDISNPRFTFQQDPSKEGWWFCTASATVRIRSGNKCYNVTCSDAYSYVGKQKAKAATAYVLLGDIERYEKYRAPQSTQDLLSFGESDAPPLWTEPIAPEQHLLIFSDDEPAAAEREAAIARRKAEHKLEETILREFIEKEEAERKGKSQAKIQQEEEEKEREFQEPMSPELIKLIKRQDAEMKAERKAAREARRQHQ